MLTADDPRAGPDDGGAHPRSALDVNTDSTPVTTDCGIVGRTSDGCIPELDTLIREM